MRHRLAVLTAAAVVSMLPATAAQAAPPPASAYKNYTVLNTYFAHGIGAAKAVDRVAAGAKPVTTFHRDTAGYTRAMQHNRGLDRDKDSVACEKK